jgi:murein DD-endopeptidase MepM/ murein hydrolase activator NlpD
LRETKSSFGKRLMSLRAQSYNVVDAEEAFVLHMTRGHKRRRIEISRAALFGFSALFGAIVITVVSAAGYLLFRDDMLAGLLDREAQMQYAYEDRLAALRLQLDQVTSRQFIDQDGVEGKVQSLVMRQARLETRAAVVAQLIEKTVVDEAAPGGPYPRQATGAPLSPKTIPTLSARGHLAAPQELTHSPSPKPQPEGMYLRLGHDEDFEAPLPPAPRKDHAPLNTSMLPRGQKTSPSLARAADPDLPMPARLNSLSVALDRVEREQTSRLSRIVKPALEAAGRLRRAFDVAGLPIERFLSKRPARQTGLPVGGPFVAAEPREESSEFERELATVQIAMTTLDGLRRALPSVPLRKPLAGELQVTSTFGYRTDPFFGRPALHSGVDLREDHGKPARATAAGVVTAAGPNGGYGNMVEIDHGGGLATRYAHLSAVDVTPGQQLAPGAIIGRVGSTGRSTGPHLHYEVRIDGEAVDPARFLRAGSALDGIAQ